MKIHEYQAKAILARYGVTIPRGEVAFSKEEAREGAARLKSNVVVVKAQIHARALSRRSRGNRFAHARRPSRYGADRPRWPHRKTRSDRRRSGHQARTLSQ